MNATDFAKAKMHFTIGLLAALFALHPFFPQFDKFNFTYMGTEIPLSWAFMAIGVCLASAVYFYATDLMTEQPSALSQRLGNWFYSMAIMIVPFYAGMYLTPTPARKLPDPAPPTHHQHRCHHCGHPGGLGLSVAARHLPAQALPNSEEGTGRAVSSN